MNECLNPVEQARVAVMGVTDLYPEWVNEIERKITEARARGKALAAVAEAARAFAAVTLGLENTEEGAALLAALEAMND